MLGTGLQFGRGRGEDRFYNSAKARRAHQNQRAEQLRRAQSDVTPSSSSSSAKENLFQREPENRVDRVGLVETQKPFAMPALVPVVWPLSNLERFLQSITPSVPAQYPSKVSVLIGLLDPVLGYLYFELFPFKKKCFFWIFLV